MLSTTISRTPSNVWRMASICICLMTLLMVVALAPVGNALRGVPVWPERHGGRSLQGRFVVLHRDRDAGRHRRGEGDRLNVVALDAGRLDGADLVHERLDVGGELVLVETYLADAGVDVAALVGAVLDLAGLLLADRL